MMKNKKPIKSGSSPTALVPYLPTQCEHRVHRKKGTNSIFSRWKKRIIKVKANILLIYKCTRDQKTISREHEEMYEEVIALDGFVVKVEPNLTGKSEKHQVISLTNPNYPQKRFYHFSVSSSSVHQLVHHLRRACAHVDITHFKIIRPIGFGTYGEVLLVQHIQTNEILAMKRMNKETSSNGAKNTHNLCSSSSSSSSSSSPFGGGDGSSSSSSSGGGDSSRKDEDIKQQCPALMKHVIQERAGLEHGRECHYIVQLKYAFQDENRWYLVMEYLQGGELFAFRQKQPDGCFPQFLVCSWAAQLITAIQLLHKKGIVHRDLKLENLLLDSNLHIRLTDFGLCKNLDVWSVKNPQPMELPHLVTVNSPAELFANSTTDGGSLTNGSQRSTVTGAPSTGEERARPPPMGHPRSYSFCGTNDYIAPEMIISALRPGQTYSYEVDWWALGVVIYELLVGESPFKAHETMALYTKILQQPVEWPPGIKISPECKDLVEKLLNKHPTRRIGRSVRGFEEQDDEAIRKHPFFKDVNWEQVASGNMPPLALRSRSLLDLPLPPSQEQKHNSISYNNTSVIHTTSTTANEPESDEWKHWEVRLDGYAYVTQPQNPSEEDRITLREESQPTISLSRQTTPSTILGALSLSNGSCVPPRHRTPVLIASRSDRLSISTSPSNFENTSPEISYRHTITNDLEHPPHISEPEILQAPVSPDSQE